MLLYMTVILNGAIHSAGTYESCRIPFNRPDDRKKADTDYIIRHHSEDFAQVGFIGTPYYNVSAKW